MFENINKGLTSFEAQEVENAIRIISTMYFKGHGGIIENGRSYSDFDFINSKQECLDALEVLKEFIEKVAPEFND